MRLLVNGCFGYGNLGDEAILAALSGRAKQIDGLELVAVSGAPNETERTHGIVAVPRSRIFPLRPWRVRRCVDLPRLLTVVHGCQGAVLGGGGVLVDLYRHDVPNYLAPLRLAQTLGRPTAVFCVGGEHLVHRSSRVAIRKTLERVRFISVRDRRTRALLIECGLPEESIFLGADPALDLGGPLTTNRHPPPGSSGSGEPAGDRTVLLFPCAYLGGKRQEEEHRREFWIDLATELRREGLNVQILPLSPRDRSWLETIRFSLQEAGARLELGMPGVEEVLRWIIESDLVVAEKLHGAVLALAAGVPPIMLAYRMKVEAFAEETGLQEWVFPAGHGELLPFRLPEPPVVAATASGIARDLTSSRQRVSESARRLRHRLDEAYARLWQALGLAR